jgi:transcriptional regulator with XRE-family HTH domain
VVNHLNRKALKEAARAQGWVRPDGEINQRRLAEALGFNESYISRILSRGSRTGPIHVSDAVALRLCRATGRSYEELFIVARPKKAKAS